MVAVPGQCLISLYWLALLVVLHLAGHAGGDSMNRHPPFSPEDASPKVLYKRALTHLPIHPDVFDPSYKRRGDQGGDEKKGGASEEGITTHNSW